MKPVNKVILTGDGSYSLYSSTFAEPFHSKHGALQESLHVFIDKGLNFKSLNSNSIKILETGFGTGLNAFLTYQWAVKHPSHQISYVGIEGYPLTMPEIMQLSSYGPEFISIHHLDWNIKHQKAPNFSFEKRKLFFNEMHLEDQHFDLIFFDAFAPTSQPELWELPMMKKMYHALSTGGVLVTYCAKGSFKRALKGAGFAVEKLPGPPGKREMTRAIKK